MSVPSSTYRVQLHQEFTFRHLHRILDYLHTLGVSTIYASPITQATPGSLHGYDVTDPHSVNTEIGDVDELRSVVKELRKKEMYWLQDIVPNHMAFHPMNHRLMDVLERGPQSPYHRYFDIDWNHPDPDLTGKVMVPFLGDEPAECVKRGEIKLSFNNEGFKIKYFDTAYPLSLSAYPQVVSLFDDENDADARSIFSRMATASEGVDFATWSTTKQECLEALQQLHWQSGTIEGKLEEINDDPAKLAGILDLQHYRLAYWKETDRRINYRRFFTVNELICLRMEDPAVFVEYHTYLLQLLRDKLIDGFRIDHIDGLQDPAKYTQMLRSEIGDKSYIIAEKILEAKEDMPAEWPLQGTSGYEFLSFLNQLLTNRKGAKQLLNFYLELVPDMPPYQRLLFDSKRLILENYMSGEWNNITSLFISLGLSGPHTHDRIRSALGLFMLSLPVYRIYPSRLPLQGKSLLTVHEAFDKALKSSGTGFSEELTYLRLLFTSAPATDEQNDRILSFLKRLMQFTGPLTAKGVEDTTFYIYNPLISHDEVGDSPAPLGMTVKRFHEKMRMRQAVTPLSLNATATHDTKRGEDARVRISVLSRIPSLWKENVSQWIDINSPFRNSVNGRTAPAINDEYFIYQSMLGGFPEDYRVTEEWIKRLQAYLNKALREAKVNTNWSEPDEQYENSCGQFIERILDKNHQFLASFIPFVKTVQEHAMVYSLSQTLIKLTAPGVPDVYQGCELWDHSFVDPDNRRPVDYEKRMQFLFQLVVKEQKDKAAMFEYLAAHRQEGIEKLFIIWKTLTFRRAHAQLFTDGDYISVDITGEGVNAAAYARKYQDTWALAIFPFGLVTHETIAGKNGENGENDQFLVLPENAPGKWLNHFTGEVVQGPNQISLSGLFRNFPVALLLSEASADDANAA